MSDGARNEERAFAPRIAAPFNTVRPFLHHRCMEILRVDCNDCVARGSGCADCVISVLLGVPDGLGAAVDLEVEERRALAVLAEGGLVPPLRLVRSVGEMPQPEEQPWLDARFAE